MTPEERAEKVYNEYGRKGSWNYFDKRMIDAIAAQIREAVDEPHVCTCYCHDNKAPVGWQCICKCRTLVTEERERCAKVCESFCPYIQNGMECRGACNMHENAKAIRGAKS